MNAHEIIQQMTPALATAVISYFYQSERDVYKTTISTLATQRKLRPVFITKKSRDKQFEWIIAALRNKRSAEIAQHLLQAWLMKARSDLLVAFLDELGVEHDGSGAVEELPKELDAAKLASAIDKVLADYPAEEVTVYLHMFQTQEAEGWPEVAEVLEQDHRLKLGDQARDAKAVPTAESVETMEGTEPAGAGDSADDDVPGESAGSGSEAHSEKHGGEDAAPGEDAPGEDDE